MSSHNIQEELRKAGIQPRGSIAVIADDLAMPLTHSVILKTAGCLLYTSPSPRD